MNRTIFLFLSTRFPRANFVHVSFIFPETSLMPSFAYVSILPAGVVSDRNMVNEWRV